MAANEKQNVWFGVSMFLAGLIAGVVLISAAGSTFLPRFGSNGSNNVAAPSAPQAPQKPVASARDRMIAYAADIGLPDAEFATCLASSKYDERINEQQSLGQAAGINGTPGNIIIDLTSGKAVVLSGAQPVANFKKVVDLMLSDPDAALKDPGAVAATNVQPVDMKKDHVRGGASATVAVIEYSDYQCPYCQAVHPTYQQLMKDYDGKVAWVYRHFPLTNIHPDALPLAVGAECAAELGGEDAFWSFTDKIMAE